MPTERNEISYYPEIKQFIEEQLKSNFSVGSEHPLNVYWGIGELKTNLSRILAEHPVECACAREFAHRVPPLSLDIFALITNGVKFELLILEVKLVKNAGLKELSQLIGYCLVSGARYGLLVNIDNGGSPRLKQILSTEHHLSHINTIVDNEQREHFLGFMEWDSLTHSFDYSNLGTIKSLSDLSDRLRAKFNG